MCWVGCRGRGLRHGRSASLGCKHEPEDGRQQPGGTMTVHWLSHHLWGHGGESGHGTGDGVAARGLRGGELSWHRGARRGGCGLSCGWMEQGAKTEHPQAQRQGPGEGGHEGSRRPLASPDPCTCGDRLQLPASPLSPLSAVQQYRFVGKPIVAPMTGSQVRAGVGREQRAVHVPVVGVSRFAGIGRLSSLILQYVSLRNATSPRPQPDCMYTVHAVSSMIQCT